MTHPLLTPRKLGRHLFVLIVVAGCITAGFWQIARLHERRRFNARAEHELALPPEPLDVALPAGTRSDPAAVEYRRVSVTGTYDVRDEAVLVGRELGDSPGNHVLTPLLLGDGRAVVVDRGWVPFAMDSPPIAGATPPGGRVTVTGVLFPPDADTPVPHGTARVSVLTKIDVGRIAAEVPARVLPVYVWLQSQTPGQSGELPRRVGLPALTEGPHFSYAVQWFCFALVGLIGYPVLLRRERRELRERRAAPGAGDQPRISAPP